MTVLTTRRLILRRARHEDVDDLYRVFANPAAMTYWSTGPHADRDETSIWLRSMIEASPEQSDDFVIEREKKVIGKLGAWRLPEIGFILSPEHWGSGFASEAMSAFVRHIFTRPDVARLTADVDPRNLRSLALLKRHGFTVTGHRRNSWTTHIGACDSVYLELGREQAFGSAERKEGPES